MSPRSIHSYRRSHLHPGFAAVQKHLSLYHHFQPLDFCMTHDTHPIYCIVFSDKKQFVHHRISRTVWIEEGKHLLFCPVSASYKSMMVWAGEWYHGRTEIAIIEGNINHCMSIDILSSYLLPSMPTSSKFLFIHDIAHPHSPFLVEKFLSHTK
jgi:hypothetical protein